MAPSLRIFLFNIVLLISLSNAQKSSKPQTLTLPIQQDTATRLYVTNIQKRTPQVPLQFVIDLNGRFLSVNCQQNYLSSTYNAPRCPSSLCAIASNNSCRACYSTPAPGCHNNSCSLVSLNPITRKIVPGELAVDALSIQSINGSKLGPVVNIPRFLFGCASAVLLEGKLPTGIHGFAGFGRNQIAVPTQLVSHFGFQQKFAICLASKGIIFLGNGPYMFQHNIDFSTGLSYTPLITNGQQGEYYIDVRSIRINNKLVPVNTSLLTINQEGIGGTKLSTVVQYTALESSIFKAVTDYYSKELGSIPKISPVSPFGLCFNSSQIGGTRLGASVPFIDLDLENNNGWRMYSQNMVAEVGTNALCLAFVDGGEHPNAAIVIGTHQMEDTLLEFDLTNSRFGFVTNPKFRRNICSNFKFTSNV